MDFESCNISFSQIDRSDHTFKISTDDRIDMLKASIQSLGLLHPPILVRKSDPDDIDRHIIVSGFRRIKACHELGWRDLLVNIIKSDTPLYRCALVAISESYFQRELNPVETATCIAMIEKVGNKRKECYQILNSIGFKTNDAIISKLKRVDVMDDRLKQGVIEGTIALPVALELCDMKDQVGAQVLIELLRELRISLSRQREILDWIQAIAYRERSAIQAVLDDEAIRNYRRNENIDQPQKANLIREHLRRRRFPEITAHEQLYIETVKSLQLHKALHLMPPANFESSSYSLKIDFNNIEELSQGSENALKLSESPLLKSILKSSKS